MAGTLVSAALTTVILFTTLVGLGVWQVRRLEWKDALLAAIDRAEGERPVPLSLHPGPFEKVVVSGRWLAPVAHYGVEVRDTPPGPRMGSQFVAALSRPGRAAVLVVLGWVVDGGAVALPSGPVEVVGYVRPAEHPGWLSAGDDVGAARFYTLDPAKIGRALAVEVEPFTVVALQEGGGAAGSAGPAAATGLPRPVNNHLSYAATWFGLAATLLAVFGVWVRKQVSS